MDAVSFSKIECALSAETAEGRNQIAQLKLSTLNGFSWLMKLNMCLTVPIPVQMVVAKLIFLCDLI